MTFNPVRIWTRGDEGSDILGREKSIARAKWVSMECRSHEGRTAGNKTGKNPGSDRERGLELHSVGNGSH